MYEAWQIIKNKTTRIKNLIRKLLKMALTPEEKTRPTRLVNAGNLDWYYGGGELAYANIAAAMAAVPIPIRKSKTVGIFISGKITEYWWPENENVDPVIKINADGGGTPIDVDQTVTAASTNPVSAKGVNDFVAPVAQTANNAASTAATASSTANSASTAAAGAVTTANSASTAAASAVSQVSSKIGNDKVYADFDALDTTLVAAATATNQLKGAYDVVHQSYLIQEAIIADLEAGTSGGASIDDTIIALNKTYSSDKIEKSLAVLRDRADANVYNKLKNIATETLSIKWYGDNEIYGQNEGSSGVSTQINGAVQKRSVTPPPETMQAYYNNIGYTNITVKNCGYPGNNSGNGLARWADEPAADIIILSYGINDQLNGLTVQETRNNLQAFITRGFLQGSKVILTIPVNVNQTPGGMTSTSYQLQKLNSVIKELAYTNKIDLIDIQQMFSQDGDIYQSDGINLLDRAYNKMGYQIAGRIITPVPKKVSAGDRFYFYNYLFPFTNLQEGATGSSKGKAINLVAGTSRPLVIECTEPVELVIDGWATSNTTRSLKIEYNDQTVTISTSSGSTGIPLSSHKTGIILPAGIQTMRLFNDSSLQFYIDCVRFERPDLKRIESTDADFDARKSPNNLADIYYLGATTVSRVFTPPRPGYWKDRIKYIEVVGTWTSGNTTIVNAAGTALTTLPIGLYAIISNGTYWKIIS